MQWLHTASWSNAIQGLGVNLTPLYTKFAALSQGGFLHDFAKMLVFMQIGGLLWTRMKKFCLSTVSGFGR
jgi:hypothetical protein